MVLLTAEQPGILTAMLKSGLFLILLLIGMGSSNTQSTTTESNDWICTTNSSNVNYTMERCNKTNKLILKVKITDDFVVNVTQSSAPPPENIEVTSEDNRSPEIFPEIPDIFLDSYEYLEEFESREHLTIPFVHHEMTETPSLSASLGESDEEVFANEMRERLFNMHFCKLSEEEEALNPMQMQRGAIHPKYEEVLGVGYYRFHTKPRKWEDARRICEQEGAHLVVINSRKEADAILMIHRRCPEILKTHFNSYSYVGVHDVYNEGQFETVHGEPLNETGYERWAFGQPDNAHHFGENCLCMNRAGFFNDVPCLTELPYFCELN